MKIIERLHIYIKHKGVSLNQFDKSIKASNGYIGKQIKNKASIGADTISSIVSIYTDLNLYWLILGEGEMLKKPEPSLYVKKQLQEQNREAIENQRETIAGLRDVNAGYKKLIEHLEGQVKTLQKQLETAGKKTTLTK